MLVEFKFYCETRDIHKWVCTRRLEAFGAVGRNTGKELVLISILNINSYCCKYHISGEYRE